MALPRSAWKEVELEVPQRKYRYPRIYEERVQVTGCPYRLRQIAAMNLGREEPTLLLTDDFKREPAALLTRYSQRTLVENGLAEAVHFFHVDALSSSIRLKVDLDCDSESWEGLSQKGLRYKREPRNPQGAADWRIGS